MNLLCQTGEWKELSPKNSPPPRGDFGMAYLGDNKVVIFGGYTFIANKAIILNDTWVYDLSENNWTEIITDIKPPARYLHVMSRLGNNKVILFGGDLEDDSYAGDTWIFDYNNLSWSEQKFVKNPRYRDRAMMAYIGNNTALLYGGWPGPYDYYRDAWIYNLATNEWDSVATTSPSPTECGEGRERAQMCEIDDHRVLLFGGWDGCDALNDNWIFDRNLGYWLGFIPEPNNYKRDSGDMAFLTENKTLLFGGNSSEDTTNPEAADRSNDTWIFDIKEKSWNKVSLNIKPTGRRFHRLSHIGDGKVFLFGGSTDNGLATGGGWLFEYKPTDVNEISIDSTFHINILNTSQNGIIIKMKNLNSEVLKIDLYDIRGNFLKTLLDDIPKSNKLEINLDTNDLQNGLFFLRFSSNTLFKSEKFIIINK